MRVVASGNLTVELIRAQRFDVACQQHASPLHEQSHANDERQNRCDRVELSPQALASDPWIVDSKRADTTLHPVVETNHSTASDEQPSKPKRLSPVVGSPALAGLGAAWVVPGTLLDVVA